jgi:hypothetical protein
MAEELDLPFGPWRKIVGAEWGGYPVSLYENPERLFLMVLFEKKDSKVVGLVVVMQKFFVVEGDTTLLKSVGRDFVLVEKGSKEGVHSFLIVSSSPKYSEFSQEAFINIVSSQYEELKGAGIGFENLKLKLSTGLLVEDEVERILTGDPSLIFALLNPLAVGGKPFVTRNLFIGKTDDKEINLKLSNLESAVAIGGDAKERLHVLHVLTEEVVKNNIVSIIFDWSNSLNGFSIQNTKTENFKNFNMKEPVGFSFKSLTLGEGLFVDLSKCSSDLFLSTFKLQSSDVAPIIKGVFDKERKDLTSISDLIGKIENVKGFSQYLLYRSVRVLKIIQKSFSTLFAKNITPELIVPWREGAGKVIHLNLSLFPTEVQHLFIHSFLESLSTPPTVEGLSVFFVFTQDAAFLSEEIQLLLKRFKKKGGGFALQAEHEIDVNMNDFSVIFNIVGKEVFMEEKGEKKVRFSIRPAFSQCTE